jgi:pyruvate dehydrogenase E1 component alpha subunit
MSARTGDAAAASEARLAIVVERLRVMLLIRAFEEAMLTLRRAREIIGPVHPYIGQEAVAAGVCEALDERDMLVSNYRGHGHAIARGASLRRLTAELFGRRDGLCGGVAAGHFCDPGTGILMASGIVAGGVPLGAGAAMSAQIRGTGGVVACFLGDGAMGAGVVHEVLNIAAVQRLPLVFVCEHNSYQSATRTEDVVPDLDLTRIAAGHRIPATSVDGNDIDDVAAAAAAAVGRGRSGEGPTFLQMHTYLTKFHIQFDVPSNERRPEAEVAQWLARDPLRRARDLAGAAGAAPAVLAALPAAAAAEVEAAIAWARAAAAPGPGDMWRDPLSTDESGDDRICGRQAM